MKKHIGWSWHPYRPPFFEVGDLYIDRVVPAETSIFFEWLDEGEKPYSVYLRLRGGEAFRKVNETEGNSCRMTGLRPGAEYEFYVEAGAKKSRIRLAKCGTAFGTVVNYLHPDDTAYAFSGRYLCSPCIVRHPDGYLLASMDLFAGSYPQTLTLIYRSDDDGRSWHYVSELFPCFWGRMFIHEGSLYMLSCSTEYGDLLIGRSDDGGVTFTEPVILLRGGNGKNGEAGVHKNPEPVVEWKGRLWNTLEWGAWGRGYHAPMVMSAPVGSDLLDPASWSFSEPVRYDPNWPGVPKGSSTGNIEGSLIIRDGVLYNVMRYDMTRLERKYGLAISYRVNTDDPEAPLAFDRCIEFPGNHSKFVIRYDGKTKKYYSIICRIRGEAHTHDRNLMSLISSEDGLSWKLERDILDKTDCDPKQVGLQYVDFIIEGDEILFLCRTAMNGAANFHDSNYSVFDRIPLP